MDKISSLQSLSDYGLGDSDIEDSDNENDESLIQVMSMRVNPAPDVLPVLHSASRVVTTSKSQVKLKKAP